MDAEILPPLTHRAPMTGPLVVLPPCHALVEQPSGDHALVEVERGLVIGWMPVPELGGALLNLRGGSGSGGAIATVISHAGIRGMIEDLKSIDAQLGETG